MTTAKLVITQKTKRKSLLLDKIFLLVKIWLMFTLLISLFLFLFPIFFLPFAPEFFETAKILFLAVFNLLFLILWFYKIVKSKTFSFKSSPFDFFILLFGASFLVSIIFNWTSLAKYQAFVVFSYILNLIILYFVIVNNSEKKDRIFYKWALTASGLLLTILSFVLFLLPKSRLPLTFSFPQDFRMTIPDIFWSPTGGTLISFSFLLPLFALLLPDFGKSLKEKFSLSFLFTFISLLVITSGLFLEGYKLVFLNKPLLLPYSIGWAICVEGFKSIKNLLFGAGPGQFFSAFTSFKPLAFNQTIFWNLRFASSSNVYFEILSTLGLFGLFSLFGLTLKGCLLAFKKKFYALIILFLLFLSLPTNSLTLFLFFVFLAFLSSGFSKEKVNLKIENNIFYFLPALILLLGGLLFYANCRTYLAEVYFQKALLSISKNQGNQAYNFEIKAIATNPYNDKYRISFSVVNLVLANNLAAKKALSDQEKQTVSQLLQQAIVEGRNAITLSPKSAANWESLASVYQNLINIAQGADQWVINAFRQAIFFDSVNPRLRVALGGVFYSLGQYESAIDLFKAAISLKPDYANSYYNLAHAYGEKKEYQNAVNTMEAVLTLVDKNSNDFQKAKGDLEEFKKLLAKPEEATVSGKPETLTLPKPVPSPKPEITPLVLPKIKEATESGF